MVWFGSTWMRSPLTSIQRWRRGTFILNTSRYYFRKTAIGNQLSSDIWLKASDNVIEGLPSVFKLVDDLLIGGRDARRQE